MAEITQPQKNSKRKTAMPRVDLTPMVDLGFLLITFFIFTTTMARAKTMEINMPYETDKPTTAYIEESTITVIPGENHSFVYYEGAFKNDKAPAATHDIRSVLMNKQKQVAALPSSFSDEAHQLHVVIKPSQSCTYRDVVDVLDEMSILDIHYYAMDDITVGEMAWIATR